MTDMNEQTPENQPSRIVLVDVAVSDLGVIQVIFQFEAVLLDLLVQPVNTSLQTLAMSAVAFPFSEGMVTISGSQFKVAIDSSALDDQVTYLPSEVELIRIADACMLTLGVVTASDEWSYVLAS